MLEQLRLSNFRAFDHEVTIRFRPITILIGKNNTGKSSVIKFLLMLQQSLSPTSDSFLVPSGEKVRLGRFSELKNGRSRKKNLTFSLQAIDSGRDADAWTLYLAKQELDGSQAVRYAVDASVSFSKGLRLRGKSSVSALLGDKVLFTLSSSVTENSHLMDFTDVLQKRSRAGQRNSDQERAEQYCFMSLAKQINLLYHIGPVTADIPGSFDANSPVATNYVGKVGQNTLYLLKNTLASEDRYQFLLSHLSTVLGIDDIAFNDLEGMAQCTAINNLTRTKTNVANLGFGVSRCLPIFVQGAAMDPHSTLMVEQPEAQIHPATQLDLATFFADLWMKRKVCSIIETHSGNILLRLRSLVALGPEQGGLSPADISIAYFDIHDGRTIVRNLDVDEDGMVEDGLPLEFFGADIEEGLKLGAARYHRSQNHAERTC